MELSYTSVTLFYSDLKELLLSAGLTVERTVADHDVILDTGDGAFLRLQKVTQGGVSSVGLLFGTDPEVLSVTDPQAEWCIPFTVTPNAVFSPTSHWVPEEKFLSLLVVPASGESKRYRVELRVASREVRVVHQDHLNPQYEPNFKDTGGPYITAGA